VQYASQHFNLNTFEESKNKPGTIIIPSLFDRNIILLLETIKVSQKMPKKGIF